MKPRPDSSSVVLPAFLAIESKLRHYLLRFLVRPADVEDAVQDTFLRAYKAEKSQTIHSPNSFLFKVARHVALNELAKKSHQLMTYMERVEELEDDQTAGADENLERQRRLAALNQIIVDLPPQCQRVMVMRKVYGFSQKEVAARLNISPRTVEKHLTKAMQYCQQAHHPASNQHSHQHSHQHKEVVPLQPTGAEGPHE